MNALAELENLDGGEGDNIEETDPINTVKDEKNIEDDNRFETGNVMEQQTSEMLSKNLCI